MAIWIYRTIQEQHYHSMKACDCWDHNQLKLTTRSPHGLMSKYFLVRRTNSYVYVRLLQYEENLCVCWMTVCLMTVWLITVECPNFAKKIWDDFCSRYFCSRSCKGFTLLCFYCCFFVTFCSDWLLPCCELP